MPGLRAVGVVLVLVAATACGRGGGGVAPAPATVATTASTAPAPTAAAPTTVQAPAAGSQRSIPADGGPFGVMLPPRLEGTAEGAAIARALGVAWLRPARAVFTGSWQEGCAGCLTARAAGLHLALTVRAGSSAVAGPSAPPTDMAAYREAVGAIIDRYRPALVVVENEENSALFYRGRPEEYAAELAAACDVAHRRGLPCANGGLVGTLVVLLTWDHYRSIGRADLADDLARRAFTPEERAALGTPRAAQQLAVGKALLASYRPAGADYLNIHWYEPDPGALAEAVRWLRAETGLPVITNEMGQTTDDPAVTTALCGAARRVALPLVVWFGLDGPRARGLVDPDGTLRPAGRAFAACVRGDGA